MKVKILPLFLLSAAATFFTACDDSKESKQHASTATTGEIAVDGPATVTKTAIFQYSTELAKPGVSHYRHELGLISDGFTTRYDETVGLMVQGEGTSLWLTLNAPTTSLEPGTYTFTRSESGASAFDFWYGSVDVNGKNFLFTSGELTVAKDEDTYTITVNATVSPAGTKAERQIHATYKGLLESYKSK